MKSTEKVIQTVAWKSGRVRLIDQTALPERLAYVEMSDWRDVAQAIRTMVVRGAPAIGCSAALGMALGARGIIAESKDSFKKRMEQIAETFRASRPTAVNLFWAVERMMAIVENTDGNVVDIKDALITEALEMLREDIEACRAIGKNGAALLPASASVLTHCNAGALACVSYGTALGVIRAAVEDGKSVKVYADETRPRLQGMKLTAWELREEGIPVTIVADGAAGVLMREGKVDCVVVGADRIAANGDAANKIGTYSVAVLANHHKVPFYVAAPVSTIDFRVPEGARIPIEEREPVELTHIEGIRIAPEDVPVWNPAFDVTPNKLITAIVTEQGVVEPPFAENISKLRARETVAA
jgi:methylthioribose-1-phosphate isomerase